MCPPLIDGAILPTRQAKPDQSPPHPTQDSAPLHFIPARPTPAVPNPLHPSPPHPKPFPLPPQPFPADPTPPQPTLPPPYLTDFLLLPAVLRLAPSCCSSLASRGPAALPPPWGDAARLSSLLCLSSVSSPLGFCPFSRPWLGEWGRPSPRRRTSLTPNLVPPYFT